MEKKIQDNSSTDNKSVTGQDPDRYEAGYGSFNENDLDEKNTNRGSTEKTDTEDADKANVKSSLNEDKSTISNVEAPSGSKTN